MTSLAGGQPTAWAIQTQAGQGDTYCVIGVSQDWQKNGSDDLAGSVHS